MKIIYGLLLANIGYLVTRWRVPALFAVNPNNKEVLPLAFGLTVLRNRNQGYGINSG